jgi:hypothetical protein
MDVDAVDDIRHALYDKGIRHTKKYLDLLAKRYRDINLENDAIPDKNWSLILDILSIDKLFSQRGIEIFIVEAYTDMYKTNSAQKEAMLTCIKEHYHQYNNIELCWVVCDLVARCYGESTSFEVFQSLFASSTQNGKEGVVLGLDILLRRSDVDNGLKRKIDLVLKPSKL